MKKMTEMELSKIRGGFSENGLDITQSLFVSNNFKGRKKLKYRGWLLRLLGKLK